MKKLLRAALLGVLAFGLAGCSGMMGNFNLSSGAATVSGAGVSGSANVQAKIANYSELETLYGARFAGDSRTIIPDGYEAGTIDLYVYGEAYGSKAGYVNKFPVTKMTLDGSGFTLNIPRDDWELTAIAVKKDETGITDNDFDTAVSNLKLKAVLIGTAQLMLSNRPQTPTVSFTLSPDGLETPGTMQNVITFSQWPENLFKLDNSNKITSDGIFDEIEVCLKNKKTGDIAAYVGDTPVSYDESNIVFNTDNAANSLKDFKFTFSNGTTEILPGTYLLSIKLSDSENSRKTVTITDDYVVLPGVLNNKAFTIQNRLDQPAAAPTDFKLSYSDEDAVKQDMYTMNFQWTRAAAKNEEWFEILFVDITGVDAVPAITAVWDTSTTPPAVKSAYSDKAKYWDFNVRNDPLAAENPGDPNYIYGSLTAGNTALKMYAELGHQYVAWIRAVNVSGPSGWVGATYDGNVGTTFTDADTANLFRIEYNLCGGAYGDNGEIYNKKMYHIYTKINGSGAGVTDDLWNPDNLKYDGIPFQCWVTNPANPAEKSADITYTPQNPDGVEDSGDEFDKVTAYKGYKNIELYAHYYEGAQAVTGSIKIRNKQDYDIVPKDFIGFGSSNVAIKNTALGDITALTATDSRTQETIVAEMDAGKRTFETSFTLPEAKATDSLGNDWNYDAVTIELRSQLGNILAAETWGYDSDVPAANTPMTLSYTFPDTFKPQCCTVRITAVYAGQSFSYTYNVQVRQ